MGNFIKFMSLWALLLVLLRAWADPLLFLDTKADNPEKNLVPAQNITHGEMYRYISSTDEQLIQRYREFRAKHGNLTTQEMYKLWPREYERFLAEQEAKQIAETIHWIESTKDTDLKKDEVGREQMLKHLEHRSSAVREAANVRLKDGALGDDPEIIERLLTILERSPGPYPSLQLTISTASPNSVKKDANNSIKMASMIGQYLERLPPARLRKFIAKQSLFLNFTFNPTQEALILKTAQELLSSKKIDPKQKAILWDMIAYRANHPDAVNMIEQQLFNGPNEMDKKTAIRLLSKSKLGRERLKARFPVIVADKSLLNILTFHLFRNYSASHGRDIKFDSVQERFDFLSELNRQASVLDSHTRSEIERMFKEMSREPLNLVWVERSTDSGLQAFLSDQSAGGTTEESNVSFTNTAHVQDKKPGIIRCMLDKLRGK